MPRARIEWVKERGGVEEYEGRPIQPVDNGNVTGKHLARNFPNTPKPWRAVSSLSPLLFFTSPLPPPWGEGGARSRREGGRSHARREPPSLTPPHKGEGVAPVPNS